MGPAGRGRAAMSDFRAIAAMTWTLRNILQEAVADLGGARVRAGQPEKDAPEFRHGLINIFLYQVEHNPSWRNMELPVRRADGTLVRRPQLAIDLHYLLSFYGEQVRSIPQLLLGKAVTTLHAFPNPLVRYMPRDGEEQDPLSLAGSGLADQVQLLRFTPISLSHEELSKLWTVFFQVPYALSVAYRCSVILLEPEDLVPEPALPVREYQLYDISEQLPEIDQVVPQVIEASDDPRLLLRGRNLGSVSEVRIGGQPAPIEAATEGSLTVSLPAGLRAGVQLVQAVRDVDMGDPPTPHRVFQSNPASFVLQPRVTSLAYLADAPLGRDDDATGPAVRIGVRPPVAPGQRVALLLNRTAEEEAAPLSLELPAPAGAAGEQIVVPLPGAEAGTYLARLVVDGVSSRLKADDDPASPTFDRYVRPALEVP